MGCDLVLGVEWLETLGFIGWHFKNKIMEFQINGTNYRLVGLHAIESSPFSVSSRVILSPLIAFLMHTYSPFEGAPTTPLPIKPILPTYSDLFNPVNI